MFKVSRSLDTLSISFMNTMKWYKNFGMFQNTVKYTGRFQNISVFCIIVVAKNVC